MREYVCVWLDCPLTISLLCQLWVGEGKQMVIQKVSFSSSFEGEFYLAQPLA